MTYNVFGGTLNLAQLSFYFTLISSIAYRISYSGIQVSSAEGGHDIGRVYKQWSGFVRELATDADNFGVSCKFASSSSSLFLTWPK